MNDKLKMDNFYSSLTRNINPAIKRLKEYVTLFQEQQSEERKRHQEAVAIKIASETDEPSLLAKTMTRYQLFQEKNSLWAKGLTVEVIETALRTYRSIERPSQAEFFKEHFDDYCQNEHRLANALRLGTAFKKA